MSLANSPRQFACGLPVAASTATFHLEHITPRAKGGSTELSNLALACPNCNLHKADRTRAVDPDTGELVPLFHPTVQSWPEHFQFRGYSVRGVTSEGRATVAALDLNSIRRQRIRAAEERLGLFPPDL